MLITDGAEEEEGRNGTAQMGQRPDGDGGREGWSSRTCVELALS
uniref:Uncharacterized protein n=1 Tax=Peronospora matthiolae TaxID=2874970 RepID=A0AAV1UFX4_9STRA